MHRTSAAQLTWRSAPSAIASTLPVARAAWRRPSRSSRRWPRSYGHRWRGAFLERKGTGISPTRSWCATQTMRKSTMLSLMPSTAMPGSRLVPDHRDGELHLARGQPALGVLEASHLGHQHHRGGAGKWPGEPRWDPYRRLRPADTGQLHWLVSLSLVTVSRSEIGRAHV